MVGLDAAGKTTILYKLKLGEIVTTIPTIGRSIALATSFVLVPQPYPRPRDLCRCCSCRQCCSCCSERPDWAGCSVVLCEMQCGLFMSPARDWLGSLLIHHHIVPHRSCGGALFDCVVVASRSSTVAVATFAVAVADSESKRVQRGDCRIQEHIVHGVGRRGSRQD